MKKTELPIVVEQNFNVSVDIIWNAITELEQMHQWYFPNIPSFKPELGFETRFTVKNESRDFIHVWKVTEVIPRKKLVYSWKYENYSGDSFVTFELFNLEIGTKVKLTHYVTEDFPDDLSEFKRESGVEGWKYFIQQALKEYLEKKTIHKKDK